MLTEKMMDLMAYLERECGGKDQYEFWGLEGEPDITAARGFAEHIREQLGGFLHDFVEVEQRVNIVTLTVLVDMDVYEAVS